MRWSRTQAAQTWPTNHEFVQLLQLCRSKFNKTYSSVYATKLRTPSIFCFLKQTLSVKYFQRTNKKFPTNIEETTMKKKTLGVQNRLCYV